MNKQEAIRRIKIIKREAHRLQEIIDAPEKPKLRHGDCWWSDSDNSINIFMEEFNPPHRKCVALPYALITNIGSGYNGKPILGNIFDLMKDWNKDLTNFEKSVRGGGMLRICQDVLLGNGIEFYIPGGMTASASLSEAEEIWHKLGQMIATLKRKEAQDA